jgi:uncharacterized protein (TIGR02284 family)
VASTMLDHLKSLHTSAIDARNGYREALKNAEGKEAESKAMTALFRDMIALHDGHASELARELTKNNELADDEGSFMTTVHETIMDVRSMFDGLDESVLPGLIDGEKRHVSKYDAAIEMPPEARTNMTSLLTRQRDSLEQKISFMETVRAASENVS